MKNTLAPGLELIRLVRGGFIAQGQTLAGWCRQHRIHVTGARQALIGTWDGPKGRALRQRLVKAAGVSEVRHDA